MGIAIPCTGVATSVSRKSNNIGVATPSRCSTVGKILPSSSIAVAILAK